MIIVLRFTAIGSNRIDTKDKKTRKGRIFSISPSFLTKLINIKIITQAKKISKISLGIF